MKYKTIQLSAARYARLVAAAQVAGFVVKPGPGSQLGTFIDHLLDNAPQPIEGDTPAEIWSRWNTAAMPQLNALAVALAHCGKSLKIEFDADKGAFSLEQHDF